MTSNSKPIHPSLKDGGSEQVREAHHLFKEKAEVVRA
jgi:hypothetical protein